jgi:hypothetical protein
MQTQPCAHYAFDSLGRSRIAALVDEGGEDTIVAVYSVAPDTWRLVAEDYYGPRGKCELTITQDLGRALRTFGALLVHDANEE